MAKKYNNRVVSIKPTSIAMLEGTLGAVIGFVAAVLLALRTTVDITQSTESVLVGMTFGVASGALAILVVPLVYFGIGWLVGLLHGVILNFLIEASGGIELDVKDNK